MSGRPAELGRNVRARARSVLPALPTALVVAVFVGSRAYYRLSLHAVFDAEPLRHFIQFADSELLRTDLFRTLFSLNHQAPLLNFVVGLALKLSAKHYPDILDVVFVAAGLTTALSLLWLQRRLGVRPWLAAIVASIYTAAPPVVFYEMWLIYHQLVSALLLLSMIALVVFVRRKTLASGLVFFSMLALLVLTRATYGLAFMAMLGAIVVARGGVPLRMTLKAAAIPALVIALYTIRVPLLTGRSLGYAIVGPNLAEKTMAWVPVGEQKRLYESGEVSHITEQGPFFELDLHPQFRVDTPKTGYPALDEVRQRNGEVNANALEYVRVADRYTADAKVLLRTHPEAYVESVAWATWIAYFRASTDVECVPDTELYRTLARVDGKFSKALGVGPNGELITLRWLILLALGSGMIKLLSRRGRAASRRGSWVLIAVTIVTIVYSSAVMLLVSWADFSRYRVEIDALYALLFAVAADDALTFARRIVARIGSLLAKSRAFQTGKPVPTPHEGP